jgi:hypothetical protein
VNLRQLGGSGKTHLQFEELFLPRGIVYRDSLPMKLLLALAAFFYLSDYVEPPDGTIPESAIALIRTTDYVEVKGTNELGGAEDFSIHNAKAIGDFVKLVTAEHFVPAPKNLKPDFKSKSLYRVRLFSRNAPVLELQIIADTVIDLPNSDSYYMESSRHSDVLLAPLLRLR